MTTAVGHIVISYELATDGDLLTNVQVGGDIPLVVQLGLLRLAEDTLVRGTTDE